MDKVISPGPYSCFMHFTIADFKIQVPFGDAVTSDWRFSESRLFKFVLLIGRLGTVRVLVDVE